jgi:hypothetical protein
MSCAAAHFQGDREHERKELGGMLSADVVLPLDALIIKSFWRFGNFFQKGSKVHPACYQNPDGTGCPQPGITHVTCRSGG